MSAHFTRNELNKMPRWTSESRAKQAAHIRIQRPWTRSTGPKTAAGKSRARWNAYKHGCHSAAALRLRGVLRLQSLFVTNCLKHRRFAAPMPFHAPHKQDQCALPEFPKLRKSLQIAYP